LWKKHLLEEQDTLDSRFRKNEVLSFKNAFSPIEQSNSNNYNEVEFEFSDSHIKNLQNFKGYNGKNANPYNTKENSHPSSIIKK